VPARSMITTEERQARKIMGQSNLMRGLAQNRPHSMMSAYRRVTSSQQQRGHGLNWTKYDMSNIFEEAMDQANQQREPTMEQVFAMSSPESQLRSDSPASAGAQLVSSPLPADSPSFETDESPQSTNIVVRSPLPTELVGPPCAEPTCADSTPPTSGSLCPTGDKVIHLPSQGGDLRVAGSYASCKVPQLVDECIARGVKTKRNMRKAALVKLLQEHDRAANQ